MMKDFHGILPNLDFDDIEGIATATVMLEMYEGGENDEVVKTFARTCTEIEESDIERLSPEWCRGFILFMSEKNNELARSAAQQ